MPSNCRVFTAISPANQWGWSEIFANRTNHLLELLVWQNSTPNKKGERARHNSKKPKPYLPEFMKPKNQPASVSKDTDTMTVDDVKSWLTVPRGV